MFFPIKMSCFLLQLFYRSYMLIPLVLSCTVFNHIFSYLFFQVIIVWRTSFTVMIAAFVLKNSGLVMDTMTVQMVQMNPVKCVVSWIKYLDTVHWVPLTLCMPWYFKPFPERRAIARAHLCTRLKSPRRAIHRTPKQTKTC